MKQPDTAALRERLANYTPERQFEEDKEEADGLLRKIQIQVTELRNILNGIENLKAELNGIHGSLKQTLQREREANKALLAAKDSADNIVDGICSAIVKAEQNTVIPAKVGTEELTKVNQCTERHIKKEEALLESHRNKMAGHLRDSDGVWLSNRWFAILVAVNLLSYLAVVLWAFLR